MPRNLDRRVEVLFPVTDPAIKKALLSIILDTELRDNQQLRLMNGDGTYERKRPATGESPVDLPVLVPRPQGDSGPCRALILYLPSPGPASSGRPGALPLIDCTHGRNCRVREADDIEHVHRMRVASRRLRAALPLFANCFPEKSTGSGCAK